ncbi:MAG: type IV pilin protein [Gammaproteobacteria bacterium]|nr:type IV pilin protein [Gammaproteobacteria bacterium]
MRAGKLTKGFTLIELMIVVAIISLLAAIAYPAYTDYVIKSKRSIATTALTQVAARQEQYRQDNKEYADNLTELGFPSDPLIVDDASNWVAAGADGQTYSIDVTEFTTQSYTLTATPLGAQKTRDDECGDFTLDNTGTKGVTGTDPVRDCW